MMIVTLGIKDKRPKKLSQKIRAVFRPCEIKARIKKQSRISVLQLSCELYRGKPDMKRLYPFLRGRGTDIVCAKDTDADLTPYRRFESRELSQMMMLSFVRDLLLRTDGAGQGFRIAVCDPMGVCPQIAEELLGICAGLTVVTNRPKFYQTVSEGLYEEKGASLIVSDTIDALRDCGIVLCCEAPDIHYPLSRDAVVFSAAKPLVALNNTVIYDYRVAVPYKYQRLRPEYLDEFTFLSALYSLGGVRELERLVPSYGADGEDVYTPERLLSRLSVLRRTA